MKVWEMAMQSELKHLRAEMECVRGKWEKFAETGSCAYIDCDRCPMKKAGCLTPTTVDAEYKIRRMEMLNKEVEE